MRMAHIRKTGQVQGAQGKDAKWRLGDGTVGVRQSLHLVDDGPDGGVFVQQHLGNQLLVGQQLVPQVQVCDVPNALKGAWQLGQSWQRPLQTTCIALKGAVHVCFLMAPKMSFGGWL